MPVRLAGAPPRFLAGQETALVNVLNGGLALPAFTPPRVFERGVGGAPTLVQNVETLAHTALIARYGPGWFRQVGTQAEPGSMLATIRHADGTVRIVEAAVGTPLRDLLEADFGTDGTDGAAQAILAGGYHGTWLPARDAAGLTLDNAGLRPAGASVGAGVLAALPARTCGLAETARVARYLALESAGQCGPCLNGLPRIADGLAVLAGSAPGRTGPDGHRALGRTGQRPGRVPPSRRLGPLRAERADRVRGRAPPARAGGLLGQLPAAVPAAAGGCAGP